jgi:hypothetical protein
MKLFADFRQIHVCAPDSKGDLAEAWTAKATDDRIAAAGDIVGVGTEVAIDVDVTVEVLAVEPALQKADHVTEASIKLSGGEVAVLGCTDFLPDAKRFTVAPGTWRLRATHTNLAKRERIRIQLWPGKAITPRVLTRWQRPEPVEKPMKGKPKNRKQAAEAARRGKIDEALEVLLALHEAGDAAASASAAEILAFQGRWKEMVPCANAILAKPDAVYAGNVIDDMRALLKVREQPPTLPDHKPPDRQHFDDAIKIAVEGKRFKGTPAQLAQHCFSLATAFHIDDEIIARWDPALPSMHFNEAAEVARALVRRNEQERAWQILESRLSRWYPVDAAQVLPVVLLTDPLLSPLVTRDRADLVLRTPRAVVRA